MVVGHVLVNISLVLNAFIHSFFYMLKSKFVDAAASENWNSEQEIVTVEKILIIISALKDSNNNSK